MPHVHGHGHHHHDYHDHHDDNKGLASCLAALCLCCCYLCYKEMDDSEMLPQQMMMASNMFDDYEAQWLREQEQLLCQKREKVDALIKKLEDQQDNNTKKINQAMRNIVKESRAVKSKIEGVNNELNLLESLEESLQCTTEILKTPYDVHKINDYSVVAEQAIGEHNVMKKVLGAILFLAGSVLAALGFASVLGCVVGGVGLGVAVTGIGVFASGRQKSVSKEMATLGKCLSEEAEHPTAPVVLA